MSVHLEFTYIPDDLRELAKAQARRHRGWRNLWGQGGWLIFIAAAVFFYLKLRRELSNPAPAPRYTPPDHRTFLLTVTPWAVIICLIVFFWFRRLRSRWQRAIDEGGLSEFQTMDIDDSGIAIEAPGAATKWKWNAYVGWVETANLFILHMPGILNVMIPKRAAEEPEVLEEIRNLLRNNVIEPTGGFPVVPKGAGGTAGG